MKILVAYASRHQSTHEIADAIGRTLTQQGFGVDVRAVDQIHIVAGYDAVVLGSAIRAGEPLPEALAFLQHHRETLSFVPVAFFAVGLHEPDSEEGHKSFASFLAALPAEVKPVSTAHFRGVMDPQTLSWWMQLLMKIIHTPTGDLRDWAAIRAWAERLPASLGLTGPVAGATA